MTDSISPLLKTIIQEEIANEGRVVKWPEKFQNSKTKRFFEPQSEEARRYVFDLDTPFAVAFIGPEGSGKTVHASIKMLNKLRRGMDGALVCPSFPFLKRIWAEVVLWLDPSVVIEKHREMLSPAWEPYRGFQILFHNEIGSLSTLHVMSVGQDLRHLEAQTLSFYYLEEIRSFKDEKIISTALGRLRLDGPNGEPPQLFVGSSPVTKDHFFYKYFRDPIPEDSDEEDDGLNPFREQTKVVRLSVKWNISKGFVSKDYYETRGLTLNENEKRMLQDGEWGEVDGDANFIYDPNLWYRLYDPDLKPLRKKNDKDRDWSDSCVIALDAGIKNDHFGLAMVSRNPKNRKDVAVRLTKEFIPTKGKSVDFAEVKEYVRDLIDTYSVIQVTYDPYQLYEFAQTLQKEKIVWLKEFTQNNKRSIADTQLLMLILQSRISHTNDQTLNTRMVQAGVKFDANERYKRIVKKNDVMKVDIPQCVSMASYEILKLNI